MRNNKMLSYKLVFYLYLTSSLTRGSFIPKFHPEYTGDYINRPDTLLTESFPDFTDAFEMPEMKKEYVRNSNKDCPSDKSLVSENDVRLMIDHVYKELSIDEHLKEAFNSQVAEIRDTYTQDLEIFVNWFQNQPEHLKHVLESLSHVRIRHIEPNVKRIAKILETNTKLEELFKDKENQFGKLKVLVKKYDAMCSYNCEDTEDHYVLKREAPTDNICISLSELHTKIEQGLNESIKHIRDNLTLQLSTDNKNYNESIDKIKVDLKDKALQIFGRTMYDILLLQDEYHHFDEDMNVTVLETDIYSIQKFNVELDDKLLQLNKVLEKYKDYCRNCAKVFVVSKPSKSKIRRQAIAEDDSSKMIDTLINIKFNETNNEILNDWRNILKDLNELIQKAKTEDVLNHLIPIQEEVVKIIQEEREELGKLKKIASHSEINKIYELMKRSQELLNNINESIKYVESRI